ncbi:hypothetical protein M0R45_031236 [Rubus argutus]|uniref:Uncharacterized protein n=1 Tax=Rubus argutus TaxID=59490 RepID=A0AAW1WFV2_RUBAR
MSDSESRSVSSGNAFSGESERSLSVEAVDSDASSTSSTSSSRSCSSATEQVRDHIMFETVMRRVETGEDIEPLAAVPYKKSGPSKGSSRSGKSSRPTGVGQGETSRVSSSQPVGFAVDRLKLSASTEDELVALREAFNIPDSVTMRLPEKGELRSASAVPGETLVHPFFFGEGMRIPLPAYQQRFLAEVGLAIAQLNPNTWRCLNALYTLYHHCRFGEPDLAVFFNQWALEEHSKADKGWYKLRSVLKPCTDCPRDTEWMDFTHKYRKVSQNLLKSELNTPPKDCLHQINYPIRKE